MIVCVCVCAFFRVAALGLWLCPGWLVVGGASDCDSTCHSPIVQHATQCHSSINRYCDEQISMCPRRCCSVGTGRSREPTYQKKNTHTRGSRNINVASKTRLRKVKMQNCLTIATCHAHATFCQNGGIWGDLARLRRPGHPISGGPSQGAQK